MTEILKLSGITKFYTQGDATLEVLKSINLTVHAGEIIALVGQSGSGKSTLLQIAGLLEQPTSGTMFINGENCNDMTDKKRTLLRRQYLGFIYQYHHLLPEFTALENVIIPQLIQGKSYESAQTKAKDLLGQLGLKERLSHHPAKLSGGEQQRVAIARAIANEPKMILADEPTGNLDPKTSNDVFQLLLKLAQDYKISALVATHNPELAKKMNRCVYLNEGVLIEQAIN